MRTFHLQVRVDGGKMHDLGYFISTHSNAWSIAYRRASTEGFDILDRTVRVYLNQE